MLGFVKFKFELLHWLLKQLFWCCFLFVWWVVLFCGLFFFFFLQAKSVFLLWGTGCTYQLSLSCLTFARDFCLLHFPFGSSALSVKGCPNRHLGSTAKPMTTWCHHKCTLVTYILCNTLRFFCHLRPVL